MSSHHCRIFSSSLSFTTPSKHQTSSNCAAGRRGAVTKARKEESKDRALQMKGTAGGVMLQTPPPVTPSTDTERTHMRVPRGQLSPAAAPLGRGHIPEVDPKDKPNSGSSLGKDRRRAREGWAGSGEGAARATPQVEEEYCGRERLKRHRVAMAGRVWIPETWGQETLLKDWMDCAAIDRALVPSGLLSAREALVEEFRRVDAGGFLIDSRRLST